MGEGSQTRTQQRVARKSGQTMKSSIRSLIRFLNERRRVQRLRPRSTTKFCRVLFSVVLISWGTALGLQPELSSVLQRSLDDVHANAALAQTTYFPTWYVPQAAWGT